MKKQWLLMTIILAILMLNAGIALAVNHPPSIDAPPAPVIFVELGDSVRFSIPVSDPDGDILSYSLVPCSTPGCESASFPEGAAVNASGIFSWTPINDGYYSFDVLVSDGLESIAVNYLIFVAYTPAAPTGLVATEAVNAGLSNVVLAWTDNSDNEGRFIIQRADDASFATGVVNFSAAQNITTFSDLAVQAGNTYYYRVYADGAFFVGDSVPSNIAAVTTSIIRSSSALPDLFYGTATINGYPAPVGTVIYSQRGGSDRGNSTIIQSGVYGGAGGLNPKLAVYYYDDQYGRDNSEITFLAADPTGRIFTAEQVITSSGGAIAQLNLAFGQNSPPVVAPIPLKKALVGVLVTFNVSANDTEGDVLSYALDATDAPYNTSIDSSTGVFTWTPHASGVWDFHFLVSDGINPAVRVPVSIKVGLVQGRSMSLAPGDTTINAGETLQFDANVYDWFGLVPDPQPPITWTSSNPTVASVDSNGLTRGLSGGSTLITASSITSVSAILKVKAAPLEGNGPPYPHVIPVQNIAPGDSINFTVFAEDLEGDTLTYSLFADAPQGAVIGSATGLFTWTPPVSGNSYDFYKFHIGVSDGVNPPSLAEAVVRVGSFVFSEIKITPRTAFVVAGVPNWFSAQPIDQHGWPISINYTGVSWTVSDEAIGTINESGLYGLFTGAESGTVTITAAAVDTNSDIGASGSASVTVKNQNEAVVIEVGSATVLVNGSATIPIQAKNLEAAPGMGIYHLFLEFDPLSMQVEQVLEGDQPFGIPLTFEINNAEGFVYLADIVYQKPGPAGNKVLANVVFKGKKLGKQEINITVNGFTDAVGNEMARIIDDGGMNVNTPPVITQLQMQTVMMGDTLSFNTIASDADGHTLSYSLSVNAPAGAYINPSTGVFSWTPTVKGGMHNFDVLAYDGISATASPVTVKVLFTPETSDDYAAKNNVWQKGNQTIALAPDCGLWGCSWTRYCFGNLCDPSAGNPYAVPLTIGAEGTTYFRYSSQGNDGTIKPATTLIIKIDRQSHTNNSVTVSKGSKTYMHNEDSTIELEIDPTSDQTVALSMRKLASGENTSSVGIPSLGKYVEITAPMLEGKMNATVIKVHYTDAELSAAGLDESTLRLHYYNASSGTWAKYDGNDGTAPDGGVDTASNIVWARTDHFSTWGIFGTAPPAPAPQGGGGSGGSSGTVTGGGTATTFRPQGRNIQLGEPSAKQQEIIPSPEPAKEQEPEQQPGTAKEEAPKTQESGLGGITGAVVAGPRNANPKVGAAVILTVLGGGLLAAVVVRRFRNKGA